MATVTLDHVSKRYRGIAAVRDMSVEVAHGESLVLVGPSGCGKTTALRLIAGLERPDEGTISIGGRVVNDVPPRDRNVAMVAETYALYPFMAVRGNLDFPLRLQRTPPAEVDHRVSAVAASMELGHLLARRPRDLAAGEAQHVAIGRAVIRDRPAVLLLDDALSSLDARQRLDARAEIGRLHRDLGITVITVTHDQAEALALGDRVAVMLDGAIQQVATPRALYERPATSWVAGFIGSPPMNLIEMILDHADGRTVLRAGSLVLPLPEPISGALRDRSGSAISVGIRPEDMVVLAPIGEDEQAIRGRCELVESLGRRVLLHVRAGDLQVRAYDDPVNRVRPGDIVDCRVTIERIHLFDARTGRAIEPDPLAMEAGAAG